MSSKLVRHVMILGLLAAVAITPAAAKVFMTIEERVQEAFPGAEIERDVLFPTDQELTRARALAGVDIPAAPVYRYLVFQNGKRVGTAYPDKHRVRTLPETLLVLVTPDGRVQDITVLAFSEPEEYMPSGKWYAQFNGAALTDNLRMRRGIDGVTGATLTARATTQAARRILALHQVLDKVAAP